MKNQKIGLFGGTFNPPHIGHARALDSFCENLGLDAVYIMPSSIPPHKIISGADSPARRFFMAKSAFEKPLSENSSCRRIISATEISRSGKSYTIDTINTLLSAHSCEKIYMYIGSDMLFYFEKWKSYRELFEKCVLVTAARCEEDEKELVLCCERYRREYGCEYVLLPIEPFEISSTELRDAITGKNNDLDIKKYLTDGVYRYIMESDVYAKLTETDISSDELICNIREDIKTLVDEKRLSHILSVEKTALELAKIYLPLYGFSEEYLYDISAACLLHDITKCKSAEWQNEYLSKFEYFPCEFPAVIHSFTGAYLALEQYFANPRVFRAVYNHTTGRADMDIFEKILFLADYIEPERSYSSCIELRIWLENEIKNSAGDEEKLKIALNCAVLTCLGNTLTHLENEQRPVFPALFEAKEFLEKQLDQ